MSRVQGLKANAEQRFADELVEAIPGDFWLYGERGRFRPPTRTSLRMTDTSGHAMIASTFDLRRAVLVDSKERSCEHFISRAIGGNHADSDKLLGHSVHRAKGTQAVGSGSDLCIRRNR